MIRIKIPANQAPFSQGIGKSLHSSDEALKAEREFDTIFIHKGIPDTMTEFTLDIDETKVDIIKVMVNSA